MLLVFAVEPKLSHPKQKQPVQSLKSLSRKTRFICSENFCADKICSFFLKRTNKKTQLDNKKSSSKQN